MEMWKVSSFLHHRSACLIARRSRLWMTLCLGSWRLPLGVFTPQECVQNRATYTGKVFTVCHHCDDQASTVDIVGLIKGLDKNNMPRPGDVKVPVPQINQGTVAVTQHVPQESIELVPAGHVEQVVSCFDRKSQRAPLDEPWYRFRTKRSSCNSRSKLKCFWQIFRVARQVWVRRELWRLRSCSSSTLFSFCSWTRLLTCLCCAGQVLGSRLKLWRFLSCSSSIQFVDEVVDMPVVHVRFLSGWKTPEDPQLQFFDGGVVQLLDHGGVVPAVVQRQMGG